MRPKASILILLTFSLLMVLGSVALACPGVDYNQALAFTC
jgi:hypothetical protein